MSHYLQTNHINEENDNAQSSDNHKEDDEYDELYKKPKRTTKRPGFKKVSSSSITVQYSMSDTKMKKANKHYKQITTNNAIECVDDPSEGSEGGHKYSDDDDDDSESFEEMYVYKKKHTLNASVQQDEGSLMKRNTLSIEDLSEKLRGNNVHIGGLRTSSRSLYNVIPEELKHEMDVSIDVISKIKSCDLLIACDTTTEFEQYPSLPPEISQDDRSERN